MVDLREAVTIYLKGLLMGIADIIPGVSGGTMALITNIYERLIHAIKDVDFKFIGYACKGDLKAAKKNFLSIDLALLIPLGLGMVTAIVTLARVLGYLLDTYPSAVFAFFFGLILASSQIVYDNFRKLDAPHIASIIAGFLFVFIVAGEEELSNNHSAPMLFFAGAIAICAMILPGISGALILFVLGQYEYMVDVLNGFIDTRDTSYLSDIGAFMTGAVIGLVTFSRVLDYMIREHRSMTMAFLFGLMLGALRVPVDEIAAVAEPGNGLQLGTILLAALDGILVIIVIQRKSRSIPTVTAFAGEKKEKV